MLVLLSKARPSLCFICNVLLVSGVFKALMTMAMRFDAEVQAWNRGKYLIKLLYRFKVDFSLVTKAKNSRVQLW